MNTSFKRTLIVSGFSLCLLGSAQALGADEGDSVDQTTGQSGELVSKQKQGMSAKPESPHIFENQKIKDAWLRGKVEVALTLNRHLNPFSIDTDVTDNNVTLSGDVESEVDKELAGQIAESIDDVNEVHNNLSVRGNTGSEAEADPGKNDWKQEISDITTSAIVKTKLLANSGIEGLSINVSTERDVVILEGSVKSAQEKDLAELIAENTDGVQDVENKLQVTGS